MAAKQNVDIISEYIQVVCQALEAAGRCGKEQQMSCFYGI
jgi:hypothetical protein